jgi:hypothetical protein
MIIIKHNGKEPGIEIIIPRKDSDGFNKDRIGLTTDNISVGAEWVEIKVVDDEQYEKIKDMHTGFRDHPYYGLVGCAIGIIGIGGLAIYGLISLIK